MYNHIINGLNNMSVEDFWWNTHNELKELGLQKKFDKQIKKMQTQEKHRYKDTRQIWEYALEKVKEE
jgi:hypothetical protein